MAAESLSYRLPWTEVVREQFDQISFPVDKAYQVVCHGKEPEMRTEAEAIKGLKLRLVFPDSSPRRIFLKGGIEFGAKGGTFISVWQ
jgi:hypothetical protein